MKYKEFQPEEKVVLHFNDYEKFDYIFKPINLFGIIISTLFVILCSYFIYKIQLFEASTLVFLAGLSLLIIFKFIWSINSIVINKNNRLFNKLNFEENLFSITRNKNLYIMKGKVNESKASINIERKMDINYNNIHSMKFIDIIDSESNKYIIPGGLKNELIKKEGQYTIKEL